MQHVLILSLCFFALTQPVNIEFDEGVAGWRTVLDGVMGGLSTGRVDQTEPGILTFSGELSLENNGGFSQIRTAVPKGSFEGARGVEIRVRGDGRTYLFDVRCSDVRTMAGGFQSEFDTVAGEWVTLRLPFEQFGLYSFGRPVPNAPDLTPARVESIGVTLADKKEGPFQLEIDFIRADTPALEDAHPDADAPATRDGPQEPTAAPERVARLVELAIQRGVPLFNEGEPEACAAIYEVTIAALVDLASETLSIEAVARLRFALAEGRAEEDATRRAWIFRRALDGLHEDVSRESPR